MTNQNEKSATETLNLDHVAAYLKGIGIARSLQTGDDLPEEADELLEGCSEQLIAMLEVEFEECVAAAGPLRAKLLAMRDNLL